MEAVEAGDPVTILNVFDREYWTPSEIEYYDSIDEAAINAIDTVIPNGDPKHAVYIITRIIQTCEKGFYMFTGNLDRLRMVSDTEAVSVYSNPELIGAILNVLSYPDAKVSIVSAYPVDGGFEKHPLLLAVKEEYEKGRAKGSFEIRQLEPDVLEALKQLDMENHFVVSDTDSYRIETDEREAKAMANFESPDLAARLRDFFQNRLLADSSVVEWQAPI